MGWHSPNDGGGNLGMLHAQGIVTRDAASTCSWEPKPPRLYNHDASACTLAPKLSPTHPCTRDAYIPGSSGP
eukprot:960099-Pelagomonas_calceolata.AAC.2